jgi:hypothetical protein
MIAKREWTSHMAAATMLNGYKYNLAMMTSRNPSSWNPRVLLLDTVEEQMKNPSV